MTEKSLAKPIENYMAAPSTNNTNNNNASNAPKAQWDVKVVLVGSVGVGKTSTVLRFIKDSFKEYLETTIGLDIERHCIYS